MLKIMVLTVSSCLFYVLDFLILPANTKNLLLLVCLTLNCRGRKDSNCLSLSFSFSTQTLNINKDTWLGVVGIFPTASAIKYGWGKEIYFRLASKKAVQIKEIVVCQLPLAIKTSITAKADRFFFPKKTKKFKALCLDLVHQLLFLFQMSHMHISVWQEETEASFLHSWVGDFSFFKYWMSVNYSTCAYLG